MMVTSALRAGSSLISRNIFWYSFVLEAEVNSRALLRLQCLGKIEAIKSYLEPNPRPFLLVSFSVEVQKMCSFDYHVHPLLLIPL
jgi:hypothetical protein